MKPDDILRRAMAPMRRRMQMMVGRAVIAAVEDGRLAQALQIELLEGESHDLVERFQEYGFTSHPLPGAEAAVVFVGGLRSHGLVVGVEDRRYRLKGLEAGEVALYDDQGQVVRLTRQGIVIESEQPVTIRTPHAIVDAELVDLAGEGGQAVARIGDDVDLGTGKIISGSTKVKAA